MAFFFINKPLWKHDFYNAILLFYQIVWIKWEKKFKNVIKVRLSPSKKILCYLLDWKLFKGYQKGFSFHLKNFFCCHDIWVFITTFWLFRKNGLIRKISLTSKFMTSQTIAINILPNISQSEGNQIMKFGQLIEYNKINIFLQD